jgi:hypothetical protein
MEQNVRDSSVCKLNEEYLTMLELYIEGFSGSWHIDPIDRLVEKPCPLKSWFSVACEEVERVLRTQCPGFETEGPLSTAPEQSLTVSA